jgi:hypothetical protein
MPLTTILFLQLDQTVQSALPCVETHTFTLDPSHILVVALWIVLAKLLIPLCRRLQQRMFMAQACDLSVAPASLA